MKGIQIHQIQLEKMQDKRLKLMDIELDQSYNTGQQVPRSIIGLGSTKGILMRLKHNDKSFASVDIL